MYRIEDILEKLNYKQKPQKLKSKKETSSEYRQQIILADIMGCSFSEISELAEGVLTWGESNFLYKHAQEELIENKVVESRILSRSNPQLANAIHLGIQKSTLSRSYDELFGSRTNKFVKPGSVASMFSPAGYLTELYREARGLHHTSSEYHLDKRRPDLASLALSQKNMDNELSTLSLSNELLLSNIQAQENKDSSGVMEMLSTHRQSGATPFHLSYEATRQAILLQDEDFSAFRRNPDVASLMDPNTLLAIKTDISPELQQILVEEITDDNIGALIKKNFGDIDVNSFMDPIFLANYYSLEYSEVQSFFNFFTNKKEQGKSIELSDGGPNYKNDQLITLLKNEGGRTISFVINRVNKTNYESQLNYSELIPKGKNEYSFNFSVKTTRDNARNFRLGTRDHGSSDLYAQNGFVPQANVHYSIPIVLSDNLLNEDPIISISRLNSGGGGYNAGAQFNVDISPIDIFLLRLNKVIRLYKATGISPSDIRSIIESVNEDLIITHEVMKRIFFIHNYMQRYSINVSKALVFSGTNISQVDFNDEPSLFTRLFNTPLLNYQEFVADGSKLTLKPADVTDVFRSGVLKRAFEINDTELYALWSLIQGKDNPPDFTCTIGNLSALYRMWLQAKIHNLSVTELAMLMSVSPYASHSFVSSSDIKWIELTTFIDNYTQWMRTKKLSVGDVFLMTTTRYSTAITPDIENLLTTLKNGLASQIYTNDTLLRTIAPYIAAASQLDSTNTAIALLQWLDQLKPQGLTIQNFHELIIKSTLTLDETKKICAFCQVLGQLVLIVRTLGLTEAELSLAVVQPTSVQTSFHLLRHDIGTVLNLSQLHDWINQCGESASEVLAALGTGTLTPVLLSQAMGLDGQMVIQGLEQVSQSTTLFSNWPEVHTTLQWVDIASTLNITPVGVAKLINLKYTDIQTIPTYSDWTTISNMLQVGLNRQQTTRLTNLLEEASGDAISTYCINSISPSWVINRNDLYQYMLIDNQVSAQVKTTRLAEAIASVQLYVNRALSAQEGKVDSAAKSRQFFIDWDSYNKRYSTWAGVSQLAYYPENYIDPTLRKGQTGMMKEMLQSISQSQLTSDSVENAFKTYMTRFEKIANLEVISGYHDNTDNSMGKTYLIGRSPNDEEYYWRTLDQNMFSNGKYPANAWSEWQQINIAMSPLNGLVRPVLFNSRLYIIWTEEKEIGKDKEKSYELKFSFIQHDGTWSSTNTEELSDHLLAEDFKDFGTNSMYCSVISDVGSMVILYYRPQKNENDNNSDKVSICGLIMSPGHVVKRTSEAKGFRDFAWRYFDTTSQKRINQVYLATYSVPGKINLTSFFGDHELTIVSGENVYNCKVSAFSEEFLEFNFSTNLQVIYNGYKGRETRHQVNLMKHFGKMGDKFYVYKNLKINPDNNTSKRLLYPVYLLKNSNNAASQFLVYSDSTVSDIKVWEPNFNITLSSDKKAQYFSLPNHSYIDDHFLSGYIFINGKNYTSTPDFGTDVRDGYEISTAISTNDVKVTVSSGSATEVYSAPDFIDDLPNQEFDGTVYSFKNLTFKLPISAFVNGKAEISFNLSAKAVDRRVLGASKGSITISQNTNKTPMLLSTVSSGAQYIEKGAYRTRLNTLFSNQLIARANSGINSVLAMDTQKLPEPKLGEGTYVTLLFSPYDENIHGSSPEFTIIRSKIFDSKNKVIIATGILSPNSTTEVELFLPYFESDYGNENNIFIKAHYQKGDTSEIKLSRKDLNNPEGWKLDSSMFPGLKSVSNLDKSIEPMDFSGANALHFWEMFYYVPMMVFQRLLQEQHFDEALRWIKYIWSPEGYLIHGSTATYRWNVRPLEEETSWSSTPLDSVDPDAVAQNDPMHYKVATFMCMLDLLIARGDKAYRMLERDTLNEAKMWYSQALFLLGGEPYLYEDTTWSSPRLCDAANITVQKSVQQALLGLRKQTMRPVSRTANSLLALFRPQQNEKLQSYWELLAQRLYNLRNNLSLTGEPLSLPIYAKPVDPLVLLSSAVNTSQGGADLPTTVMPLYRFSVILDNAKGMVGQLSQFGSTLLSIIERQDAEALSELLQTQGTELVKQSIAQQTKNIDEIDASRTVLQENREGAASRFDSYSALYDEDINDGEQQAVGLYLMSALSSTAATLSYTIAAAADTAPNIYGVAFGGSQYGSIARAVGLGIEVTASAKRTIADRISQSEAYRRRRQEWEIQRNAAESDVKQIDAQLEALTVRREAAELQKTYLKTQQSQTQAQLTFLRNKFSNKSLYNWLRGKLAAIYYQFYDLSVSRCLMAQEAFKWDLDIKTANFIKPGAWHGTYAGLMAGDMLMLNLAQMEQRGLEIREREKEVTRTVCLSGVYAGLPNENAFTLIDKVKALVNAGKGEAGGDGNSLTVVNKQLQATLKLSELKIGSDYPDSLGKTRRIKQISVTLPALVGPYQDVRAVLSYGGSVATPRGCSSSAISHGINDSGQFQLDFNDPRYLPFEGIPVNDTGTLTLSFPDADDKQKDMLLSLSDIILHIRYTIIS